MVKTIKARNEEISYDDSLTGIHEGNLPMADTNGITGSSKWQNWMPVSISGQARNRWKSQQAEWASKKQRKTSVTGKKIFMVNNLKRQLDFPRWLDLITQITQLILLI